MSSAIASRFYLRHHQLSIFLVSALAAGVRFKSATRHGLIGTVAAAVRRAWAGGWPRGGVAGGPRAAGGGLSAVGL